MNVRGGSDHEIESSSARLAAAVHDGGCEPAPLTRDRRVDRQRLECRFDRAEPLRPEGSFVVVLCDEDAEVQFGERSDADGAFDAPRPFCSDEDGGIEEDAHLLGEEIGDLAG